VIRLLERIADEAGTEENEANPEPPSVTIDGDSIAGNESVRSVRWKHSAEFESDAATLSPASHGDEQLSDEAGENLSEQETASCANDDAMQAEFDSMRQVLLTHAIHPLLDEELREEAGGRQRAVRTLCAVKRLPAFSHSPTCWLSVAAFR